MSLEIFFNRKRELVRAETGKIQMGWDAGKWWECWRRSGGKVFHKAGAQ